jgi:hypothetical protein
MADKKDDAPVVTEEEQVVAPVETPEEAPQETEEAPQEAPEEQEEPEQPELTPAQADRLEEAKAKGMDELSLQKLIANMTRPKENKAPKAPEALDYTKALDADEEVVKTLESDRQAYGQKLYEQGLDQAKAIEFRTMLEIDAPRIEAKYPQLDKTADTFDAEAANDVNSLYLQLVGYDPQTGFVANNQLRYRDFVDAYMRNVERLAGQKAAKSTKNVAKQAAQTAVRPSGATQRLNLNKPAEQMTDEELDAVVKSLAKK